jgi:hypothetical protein
MGGTAGRVCTQAQGARDGDDLHGGRRGRAQRGGGAQAQRRPRRPKEEEQDGAGRRGGSNQDIAGNGFQVLIPKHEREHFFLFQRL